MKLLLLTILALFPLNLTAAVKVVTSTTDLAYFTKVIGGPLVDVSSIAAPTADLHYVEVRPSYMVKVRNADLVFRVGLELDMWMNRIIDGSRNNKVKIVDCSKYIKPMEVPAFKADASYGDLHRFGNPHYWLSPDNVAPITQAIAEGLSEVDPDNVVRYEKNRENFLADLNKELPAVKEMAAPLKGDEIITYHNSWPYFAEYFGIKLAGFIEKYAGVAPSPSHVAETIDLVKGHHIKVIAMEPYFDARIPKKIASSTGANVIVLYPSIGGRNQNESYIEWLQGNIKALLEAEK
jgi:zinc/manganese transport system substrate-binding protein